MLAGSQGFGSTGNFPGTSANGGEGSEVARFEASKEKKHSLESGITVFNRYSYHPQTDAIRLYQRLCGTYKRLCSAVWLMMDLLFGCGGCRRHDLHGAQPFAHPLPSTLLAQPSFPYPPALPNPPPKSLLTPLVPSNTLLPAPVMPYRLLLHSAEASH